MSDEFTIERLIAGIWGDVKTAKTTLGLTFPKPMFHQDLDQGGHRALSRFRNFRILRLQYGQQLDPRMFMDYDIVSKPYQLPVKFPGKAITGIEAAWDNIMEDFCVACTIPGIASLVPDTATMMWTAAKGAQLERAQRTNPKRTSLIEIEYARPNQEMRATMGMARTWGKNLAIIHHLGGAYEDRQISATEMKSVRVGDTWDGFKHMDQYVDLILRTGKMQPTGNSILTTAMIQICGLTLAAEGKEIINPTFENIVAMVNVLREQGL